MELNGYIPNYQNIGNSNYYEFQPIQSHPYQYQNDYINMWNSANNCSLLTKSLDITFSSQSEESYETKFDENSNKNQIPTKKERRRNCNKNNLKRKDRKDKDKANTVSSDTMKRRRLAANARERRRMNGLNKAFNR